MPARTWKSLLAIGAVAIAAACADDQSPAPTTPGRPSFALNYTGCDFTQVRRDLKNYAVSPKDASYDLVQLLADRYKNNDVAGAKSAAFAIAARVGKIAWTDSVFKTTAGTNAGNSFLKGTFICGGIPLPSVVSFSGALGPNGLLAVRGGPSDPETPVLSRGSPTYGSETVGVRGCRLRASSSPRTGLRPRTGSRTRSPQHPQRTSCTQSRMASRSIRQSGQVCAWT